MAVSSRTTVASGILNGTLTIDTMKETFSVFVGADPARKIAPKLHAEIDSFRAVSVEIPHQ